MTLAQTELKKIYLWPNVIDMQWPAPIWYHVPSKDENVALVAAMTALWMDTSNWNCMKTYLKMPFAGCRRSSSSIYNQGETGYYWSATAAGAHYARVMLFYSEDLYPQLGDCRAFGYSIRCFKNTPAIPDNNWTTLFNWSSIATWAWIFHNTTSWLISISSDWQSRITIQDKNLWASTVYNDWDTLSEANCWKYFQWWNNYGFAWTWSITTSSTKVDASNYWPWNYYSSSTFITTDITDWSSVQNDNLWWWQYTPIKRVTIRPNGQEKQIRPEIPPYLCFTANTAGSTVSLQTAWFPTSVTIETSTDGINWSNYTLNTYITLSNIWDKVYFRNASETTTGFSISNSVYYNFVLQTWSVSASWDVTSLINKNCTDTLSWNYCFYSLFQNWTSLTTPPKLPATSLTSYCYSNMFRWCSTLEALPELPAIQMSNYCYQSMFFSCRKIKMSTTQTWEYQTAYRIPTTWTWISASHEFDNMFAGTWWTFTWSPTINTTYYTSNTLV